MLTLLRDPALGAAIFEIIYLKNYIIQR